MAVTITFTLKHHSILGQCIMSTFKSTYTFMQFSAHVLPFKTGRLSQFLPTYTTRLRVNVLRPTWQSLSQGIDTGAAQVLPCKSGSLSQCLSTNTTLLMVNVLSPIWQCHMAVSHEWHIAAITGY